MARVEWEYISGTNTQRMKVFGGWIVKHEGDKEIEGYMYPQCESMCFIPDPEHKWLK